MDDQSRNVLKEVARVAENLGAALAPVGHEELLRSITEAAKDLFGAAACSVALLDETQSELVFYVASGEGAESVEGMRMPASQGIAGWVVTSGQPMAIEDVTRDPRFATNVAESTGYVPKSILAMPMQTERQMIGVISVLDRRRKGDEGTRDMELLGLFARQAALAIENSRVFNELGRALFRAVGAAADGGDLTDALNEVARNTEEPLGELAELAAHINELSRAGPAERQGAVRLLGEFVHYLHARARPV
ncbi:MAG: GAF domain-containing protein [Actinomycetota bacterium]